MKNPKSKKLFVFVYVYLWLYSFYGFTVQGDSI